MTISAPSPQDSKSQLRKTMGFWDVLLFNIATVLGPRWIAAAGHNGTSSISLWVIAAVFFFVPGALVINELSSRFPEEGGLYAWSKEAFGDFHGFYGQLLNHLALPQRHTSNVVAAIVFDYRGFDTMGEMVNRLAVSALERTNHSSIAALRG